MATFTTKSLCGTPLAQRSVFRPAVPRSSLTVRASSEDTSRRALLGSMAAGMAVVMTKGAEAIEIRDSRKVKDNRYDDMDEARDLDLPQNTRDGLTQSRTDLKLTKSRLAESISRIKTLPVNIEKQYWVRAREELRLQVGTMRFDLDTVAYSLGDRSSIKQAKKAADNFFIVVEGLDNALRNKKRDAAEAEYEKTIAAIGTLNLG